MSTMDAISSERRALADLIDALTPAQLATPSLCGGWTVHQVAAHLVMPLVTPLPRFLLAVIGARGNFDRANDRMSRAFATHTSGEVVGALRANSSNPFHPPTFGLEAPLTELLIHGQDIRRPLGLSWQFPLDAVPTCLKMLVSPNAKRGFVSHGHLAGLRLEASDVDWSHGAGDLVRGPAAALAYAMTSRKASLEELSGPGVEVLRSR